MPPGTLQNRDSGAESQEAQLTQEALPTVKVEQEDASEQEATGPELSGGAAMQAVNGYLGKPFLSIHMMLEVLQDQKLLELSEIKELLASLS